MLVRSNADFLNVSYISEYNFYERNIGPGLMWKPTLEIFMHHVQLSITEKMLPIIIDMNMQAYLRN